MAEKKILMQLPWGELNVADIKAELTKRQVSTHHGIKMLKADLSELLRMTLEKTQTLASLIQLRAYEIEAIKHARRDTLAAKLKSRGLDPYRGDRETLLRRLLQILQQEKADLERQNKENIPPLRNGKTKQVTAITPEQRERMERNRKRALELQAEKQSKDKQQRTANGAVVSITPIRAPPPNNNMAAGVTTKESTQIAFDYCTPVKSPVVNPYATLKRTGVAAASVANLYSPVAPTKPPSTKPVTAPALTVHLSPCLRCGDTCLKQNLCIVWNHTGDIQREQSPHHSSWDQYRWDCCGRLDGQPCFVGVHHRGAHNTTSSHMVLCDCRDAASLRRTRKAASPNRGRYFFTCASQGCRFFQWADQAYGVSSKDVPLVAPDGVREWEIPYSNPYGERTMTMADPQTTKRKRLVAALLLQEMCVSVQGQGGLNCNGICSKELAASVVQTVHRGGDAILWKLQPLTSDQMTRRFGWPHTTLIGLDQKECEDVLLDLLEHSQLVKSIGIRYHQSLPGESSVFVDLAGLEAYLSC